MSGARTWPIAAIIRDFFCKMVLFLAFINIQAAFNTPFYPFSTQMCESYNLFKEMCNTYCL